MTEREAQDYASYIIMQVAYVEARIEAERHEDEVLASW